MFQVHSPRPPREKIIICTIHKHNRKWNLRIHEVSYRNYKNIHPGTVWPGAAQTLQLFVVKVENKSRKTHEHRLVGKALPLSRVSAGSTHNAGGRAQVQIQIISPTRYLVLITWVQLFCLSFLICKVGIVIPYPHRLLGGCLDPRLQ